MGFFFQGFTDDDFAVLEFHADAVAGDAELFEHIGGELEAAGFIEHGVFVLHLLDLCEGGDVAQAVEVASIVTSSSSTPS